MAKLTSANELRVVAEAIRAVTLQELAAFGSGHVAAQCP